MNQFTLSELTVGQKETFSVRITPEDMARFRAITGDSNPLHCDAGYAAEHGHRDGVVYGMLTASYLSTLAGMYLPGLHSLIQSVQVKCAAPVYVGDTLSITGEVEEIIENYRLIVVKYRMTNQTGTCVMRGKMQIGVQE